MSSIVSALDTHTSTHSGENGHTQYRWSNDIQEQILQVSFQLVRTPYEHVLSIKINIITF